MSSVSYNYTPKRHLSYVVWMVMGALFITSSLICLLVPVLFPSMPSGEAIGYALVLAPLCSCAGLVSLFCSRN
jgi:hypothetical protein